MMISGGDFDGQRSSDINQITDRLHARTPEYSDLIGSTALIISDALAVMRKPYVSFSGGKDSTVLLHMVLQFQPDIPVLYVDQGLEYPDTYEFIRQIWKDWKLNLSWEYPEMQLDEIYDRGGFLNHEKETDLKLLREFGNKIFYGAIDKYVQRIGADGFFMGLRKDESWMRLKNLKYRGTFYKRKNGLWTCCPLADWTAKDIWAYISSNKLQYNKLYDKTKFNHRNDIRVAPYALGGYHISMGSFVFLKYYYPELYNYFAEKNQLVKKYV